MKLIESTYEQLALQLTTLTTIFSTLENARETISLEPQAPFQQDVLTTLQSQIDKTSLVIKEFSNLLTQKINEPVEDQLGLKSWREVA